VSYKQADKFDVQRFLSLGREFSNKHQDFQILSFLGNEYARKRAALAFVFWLKENGKASLKEKLEQAMNLLGEAEFLKLTKAWERMTLALGDTTPRRKYNG
jgi:hypothetical protein